MGLIRRASPAPPRPQGRFRILAPRAVTASAVSVGVQDRREQAAANQGSSPRQLSRIERALALYDSEGACWYPAQFFSRSMQRIRYYPAILNENGEPEEVDQGPLLDLFNRIRDPGGTTFPQLAANYGRLRFLIGDGNLLVSEIDGEEAWEYLSPLELKKIRGTDPVQYERDDGFEKTTYTTAAELDAVAGDRVRVFRLWHRHPTKSGWSDSPVLPLVGLYETLLSLTAATRAEANSRAALRGMLFVPDELTIASDGDDEQDADEDPETDAFMREFIEGMTSAIADPGSAAAASPFIMRGPGLLTTDDGTGRAIATAEALKWLALGPQDRYLETDAAEKILARIALGLDMPMEMVDPAKGIGNANHWSGWLLDETGFRQHVAGAVEEFCSDMAAVYLRPAATAAGVPDAENVVMWYDPVAAIAHPDEFANAREAIKLGAVGFETVRKAGGFGDEDAPTEEELAIILALLGKRLPGQQDPQAAQGETAPQDGGTGADTTEQPPQQDQQAATASARVAERILGAAEIQVKAARKTAGSRIRSRSKSCDDCQKAIDGLPAAAVASALGQEQVRALIDGRTSEAALVAGAGAMLAGQLCEWGLGMEAANVLGGMVEAHALRTLYEREPAPLPAGFAAAVERAVA